MHFWRLETERITYTKMKPHDKTPKKAFKKIFCDWRDQLSRLPLPAFKIWLYLYLSENAKGLSWVSRDIIHEKCGMDRDAVSRWTVWLVENGWLETVETHRTAQGYYGTPSRRTKIGTIPELKDGRGKSEGSRKTQFKPCREIFVVDTPDRVGKSPSPSVTGNRGLSVTENSGSPRRKSEVIHDGDLPSSMSGNSRQEVDINLENPLEKTLDDNIDGSPQTENRSVLSFSEQMRSGTEKPKPPTGAVAEIWDGPTDEILVGWRMADGSRVKLDGGTL